jgi:Prealbumin-like fold domain
MRYKVFVCLGLIALATASAVAQRAYVPPPGSVRLLERYLPPGSTGETKIIGAVVDIMQNPVQNARLRLRNLTTGNVEQEGTSNENGEFLFTVLESGTYVVEMVVVDGYVVALSNATSVGRFETMMTRVTVPGRWNAPQQRVVYDRNMAAYLGVSGQLSMTAATLEIALEQNITPKDAGEPVSP